jgi:putative ABC transport system permease protein
VRIIWLALEGLRRTRLRTLLTTLGVTIASAALVSLVAFAIGLQHQVEAPFRLLALLNNVQVLPRESSDATDPATLDDAAIERFTSVAGVASAYPDIRAQGIRLRHGEKTEIALAIGLPPEVALFGVEEDIIIAGRFFRGEGKREAILGSQLLRGLGFNTPAEAVGAELTLEASGLTPDAGGRFTFQRRELKVHVVGVYEPPPLVPAGARRAVVLPVELMKEVPGVRFDSALSRLKAGGDAVAAGYASATVRVRDANQLERVAAEIQRMGFDTKTVVSRLSGMRTFFVFLQVLLAAVGTVALIVAALGIVNTLLMSVLERYEEIGLYKAIGASDGDMAVLFLTEAASFGLGGGIFGLGLGWGVSWALGIGINIYAARQGTTEPIDLFVFPPWLLVSTVVFSVVVSIAAGVYPAVRAARVDPIRALRRG